MAKGSTPNQRLHKNESQARLASLVEHKAIVFAIGPAGTGKTTAAVGLAIQKLKSKWARKIVLARPAIGAGEEIGFLPGTLEEKMKPYMIPLFDSMGRFTTDQTIAHGNQVEVTSFSYLRGRSLDDCFIIVDEAQNATLSQLEMIVTRLGEGSKMVITGDPSQCDLKGPSGLLPMIDLISSDPDVGVVQFTEEDNLRHPLVARLTKLFSSLHKGNK